MILNMYAIKDELNGFTAMIPFNNDELAKRYLFDQYIENPVIKNTPKDFSIWRIGAFDIETGTFSQKNGPTMIERCENYVK